MAPRLGLQNDFAAPDLANLESVGIDWMAECRSLASISFPGLSGLKSVGNRWLLNCTSLRRADFRGLDSLEVVGYGWLEGTPLADSHVALRLRIEAVQILRRRQNAYVR